MKTKSRISLFGALFLTALFLLSSSCLSAEKTATDQKKQAITVATVNIYEARIISQKENELKVGFNLNNRIGVQSGIKYGIELRSKGEQVATSQEGVTVYTKDNLEDQKIYSESVILGAGETVKREVAYAAPEYLQGEFEVFIISKNEAGMLLGNVSAGEVELNGSGKYLKIDAEGCYLKVSGKEDARKITERVSVSPEEEISFNCSVLNLGDKEVEAIPSFETKMRSDFGSIISEEKEGEIQFGAGEKKDMTLSVVKPKISQSYAVKFILKDIQGKVISNPIDFVYSIKGASATILNATFDAMGYLEGDTASVFVLWMSQEKMINQAPEEQEKITLKTSIYDASGSFCAESVEINSGDPRYDGMEIIPMLITKSCFKPRVTIVLTDAAGVVLDEKVLGFQEEKVPVSEPNKEEKQSGITLAIWLYLIAGAILIIGIAIAFIIKKKQVGATVILMLFFAGGIMLADTVKAETVLSPVQVGNSGAVNYGGTWAPSSYDIGALSELTYNYVQCGGNVTGTLSVTHYDNSGPVVSYRSAYANVIIGSSMSETWADSNNVGVSVTNNGSGSGTLRTYLRWKFWAPFSWRDREDYESSSFSYNPSCVPPNPAPEGNFGLVDNATCSIGGWTFDRSNLNQSLQVHVYRDGPAGVGTLVKVSTANFSRPDVQWLYGAPMANYGFNTLSLRGIPTVDNASPHSIYVYAIDIPGGENPLLSGSPKVISCTPLPPPPPPPPICSAPNCLIGGVCTPPGAISYSCPPTSACSSEEKCTSKANICVATSSNGCPATTTVAPSVCRANGVTCEDSAACPCPSNNWIEVQP